MIRKKYLLERIEELERRIKTIEFDNIARNNKYIKNETARITKKLWMTIKNYFSDGYYTNSLYLWNEEIKTFPNMYKLYEYLSDNEELLSRIKDTDQEKNKKNV